MNTLRMLLACALLSLFPTSVSAQCSVSIVASATNICAGQNISLAATGTGLTTYTWSNGSFLPNITVAPAINATLTVWATDQSGCIASNTVFIQVDQSLPVITATLINNNPIAPYVACANQTMLIIAGGANTYSCSNNSIPIGVPFFPVSGGAFAVFGSNACGTTNLNNGPTPPVMTWSFFPVSPITIVANNTLTCAGQSITLMAMNTASVSWNPPVLNNMPFAPAASGVYTANGFNNGSCPVSGTVAISVLPATPIITATANPSTVCAGNTVTLSVNGANNYTWTSSTGGSVYTSSVVIYPAQSATYSILGATGGCVSSTTLSLPVISLPVISPILSTSLICAGSQASLWISGPDSYTWYPGPVTGSLMTAFLMQSVNFTLSATNGTCDVSTTSSITVNARPAIAIIPSSATICAGSSVSLNVTASINPVQNISYIWNNGALSPTLFISPTLTSVYSVTATAANGCQSTDSVSVIVYDPGFAVSGPSTFCLGSTVTFTATGSPISYTWSGGVSGNTLAISPTVTSIYTVTGSLGNCFLTQSVTVNPLPLPIIIASVIKNLVCPDEPSFISASGAATYTWSNGLTAPNFSYIPSQSIYSATTVFTVSGSGQNGCINTAIVTQSVSDCTEIQYLLSDNQELNIRPNPNTGNFKIYTKTPLQFVIINQTSQIIGSFQIDNSREISINDLPNGVYYIIPKSQAIVLRKKIIVFR